MNVLGEVCSAVISRDGVVVAVRQVICHTPLSAALDLGCEGPFKHLTCEVGLGELISCAILILLYLICYLF